MIPMGYIQVMQNVMELFELLKCLKDREHLFEEPRTFQCTTHSRYGPVLVRAR